MKLWLLFVVLTLVCWGCYVPMLHQGQSAFGGKSSFKWLELRWLGWGRWARYRPPIWPGPELGIFVS